MGGGAESGFRPPFHPSCVMINDIFLTKWMASLYQTSCPKCPLLILFQFFIRFSLWRFYGNLHDLRRVSFSQVIPQSGIYHFHLLVVLWSVEKPVGISVWMYKTFLATCRLVTHTHTHTHTLTHTKYCNLWCACAKGYLLCWVDFVTLSTYSTMCGGLNLAVHKVIQGYSWHTR